MTIGPIEHEMWTDKGELLRMIQNGQQDIKKHNYLFISSLGLNFKINDRGHAHKSSQSCQKSKSNIVHHDNHPTIQVTIVQPLKGKETKHFLAHRCVFITYFGKSSYGSMLVLVLGSPKSPMFLGGDWAGIPSASTSGPPWCCFNVAFSWASCRYAFPMTSSSSKAWSRSVLV